MRFEDVMLDATRKLESELRKSNWKEVYIGLWVHKDYPKSCVDTNPLLPIYRSEHSNDMYIKSLSDIRRIKKD